MNEYHDETAQIRRRLDDLADDSDRPGPEGSSAGATAIIQTVQISSYPAVATAMYGCRLVDVTCAEVEGAIPTFTPYGSNIYVLNIGGSVPPVGTIMLGRQDGGLLVGRYG